MLVEMQAGGIKKRCKIKRALLIKGKTFYLHYNIRRPSTCNKFRLKHSINGHPKMLSAFFPCGIRNYCTDINGNIIYLHFCSFGYFCRVLMLLKLHALTFLLVFGYSHIGFCSRNVSCYVQ